MNKYYKQNIIFLVNMIYQKVNNPNKKKNIEKFCIIYIFFISIL